MAENAIDQLERGLDRIQRAHPELGSAIALHGRLLREGLAAAREPILSSLYLDRDAVVAHLREGVPLLHKQAATLDLHYAADLFSRLVNVLAEALGEESRDRLQSVVDAATEDRLPADRLFGEALAQHRDHLWELAFDTGVDPDLLTSLASLSVSPLLRGYATQLMGWLDEVDDGSPQGATWERGYCPMCGAWPLFAELRGIELKRYLRCSACGTGWPVRRLFCPYCENDDYRALRTLQFEGEPRFRVDVCDRCNGYLKVTNAFDPLPAELVGLDDVASLHVDVVAIERGHQRPSGTGFRLELARHDEPAEVA